MSPLGTAVATLSAHLDALRRAPRALSTLLFLCAAAALGTLWLDAQARLFEAARPVLRLASVDIPASVGEIAIGRRELGQRAGTHSAERAHLRLRRGGDGTWFASNIAQARRALLIYRDAPPLFLRRWRLEPGDEIEIAGARLTVRAIEPRRRLVLRAADGRIAEIRHRSGRAAGIVFDGPAQPLSDAECEIDRRLLSRVRAWIDRWGEAERRLIWLGGGVDCSDRIAAGAAPRAASVTYRDGALSLAPGPAGGDIRFRRAGETRWRSFAQAETPIAGPGLREDGPDAIILGRTRYGIETTAAGALRLTPERNAHLFFEPRAACDAAEKADERSACYLTAQQAEGDPQALTRIVRAEPPRLTAPARVDMIAALFVGLTAALAAYALLGPRARRRSAALRLHAGPALPSALLIGASVGLLSLFVSTRGAAAAPTLGALLVGQWAGASLARARTPERNARLYAFWLAMSVVIALGALTLAQLSHGAADARWLRFDARHQLSLMLVMTAVTMAACLDLDSFRALIRAPIHGEGPAARFLRIVPIVLLTLLFAAWLALGREEGLGDFQPIEAGKFAAVLILAVLATRLYHARLFARALTRRAWLAATVIGAALFYVLLFGVVPGLRGDLSPIVILAGVCGVLLFAIGAILRLHRISQIRLKRGARPPGALSPPPLRWRRPWLETVAMFLALSGAGVGLGLAAYEIDRVAGAVATAEAADFGTAQERIAVYLRPALHPDLGAQLLQSLALITEAPCYDWEPDCRAPARAFGPNPTEVQSLPAVQDDFILAFLLNRFGLSAAALLAAAQIVVVWLTIDAALRKYRWSGGDYVDDAARQTLCFVGLGAALMLAAHWGIAWSNAFGAVPVMGQPMSWVSAGNSHILFMAAPFLLLTVALLRWPVRRPPPPTERTPPPADAAATLIGFVEGVLPGSWVATGFARAIVTVRKGLARARRIGSSAESGERIAGQFGFPDDRAERQAGRGAIDWRGGDPRRRR